MQKMDIIFKSITLLYRESFIENNDTNNSNDLVRTILNTIVTDSKYSMLGAGADKIENLKKFTLELCNSSDKPFDKEMIRQTVSLIMGEDVATVEILMRTIEDDLVEEKLKRAILTLKRYLNNYYKEYQINDVLSKAHYRFKNNRSGIKSTNDFIANLVTNLEALELTSKTKDPAIANEVDLGDESGLSEVLDSVKDDNTTLPKLKTGWQGFNTITSGGFRRGEMVLLASLQHKYKSGTTNSLFMQVAMENKPKMIDGTKKPLLLLISLEDDMVITTDFMYRYLYNDEHGELPDFSKVTPKEASDYIKKKLSVNGYHIKMLRVNPTEWSFKHLFNKIISYEADGFELHGVFMDYLGMVPTVGCNLSGPMGTDIRDLFRRVRNFFSVRKCTFFTPHQLSVDAKMLIRNGVPEATFVKELIGKGYFSGTKQLDQELDLILYNHIAKINGKACLTISRDKHRTPVILDDEYKYFYMPFPKGAPIPSDVHREKSLAVFPDANGSAGSDDVFDF